MKEKYIYTKSLPIYIYVANLYICSKFIRCPRLLVRLLALPIVCSFTGACALALPIVCSFTGVSVLLAHLIYQAGMSYHADMYYHSGMYYQDGMYYQISMSYMIDMFYISYQTGMTYQDNMRYRTGLPVWSARPVAPPVACLCTRLCACAPVRVRAPICTCIISSLLFHVKHLYITPYNCIL